jgi:membrane dipeptidase
MPPANPHPTVAELLRSHPPIDLHADTPVLASLGYDVLRRHHPLLPRAALGFHVDLPRLREGGYAGQVFGIVTPPVGRFDRPAIVDRQIAAIEDACRRSAGAIRIALRPGDFARAAAGGAVACAFGLEGAHAIGPVLDRLGPWRARGLRYLTLTHFSRNAAGSPRFGLGARPDGGLTRFGRALVEACEAEHVLIDLAHASDRTFAEALDAARGPAIVSHAGAASVRPLWRNLSDEAIRAVAAKGGVVGVIFARWFVGGNDAGRVADHLVALWRTGGEDLPALGSDYDGLITPPRDLRDPSQIGNLVAALLERGVPDRVIGKILRENALRVLDG